MRLAAAIVLALLAAAPYAGARQQEQEPPRQAVSIGFGTTEPNAPAAGHLALEVRDPADPEAKPPSLAQVVVEYPEGTRFDFGVPEHCTASDAELMRDGEAACPPGSVVARGALQTDNGSPGGFPRHTDNVLTTFAAGEGQLVTLAESQDPETRVVSRPRIEGRRATFTFPAVPTPTPPDPFLAYRSLRLTSLRVVRGDRAFARTPEACPDGRWRGSMTFTYRDGVTQQVPTSVPCRTPSEPPFAAGGPGSGEAVDDPPFLEPRDADAPEVRLRGVPRRCVRRSFVVRVRIAAETPLRHAVVEVDGRRVALRRSGTFRVRVPVRRLRRGRHLLEVVARDRAGDLGAASRRFRRC
jgi:hypothetical protein